MPLKKRDRAHKRWKKKQTPETELAFKSARHVVNVCKFHAKKQHDEKVAAKLQNPNTNAKEYWHLTKLVYGNKVKSGIPPITEGNKVYSDSESKANLFNTHFTSKSKLPLEVPALPEFHYLTNARLDLVSVEIEETEKILNNLDTSKANGPDNISNRILKTVSSSISSVLTKLCNMSLRSGVFPDHWKEAHVTPVFKKNDKQNKNNYRPISLLSNLAKVLERHVFMALYKYCIDHNLLTWRNSGYKYMDSTINQLVHICHRIYEALENGQDVCFVSLDASAAFDRVWHKGLLFKLKQIGISGILLKWIESYLTNRRQRVVIGGKKSDWSYISAGVPQGSILGPLLFLIYINDIIVDIDSEILLFADDTCLLEPVADPRTSIAKLNSDLNKLSTWAKQWLVNFNPTKTKFMLFSKKLNITAYNQLYLDGEILSRVKFHCQLGIIFNENMTWDNHVREKCNIAMKRVTLLKRVALNVPRSTKLSIYLSFIRPILEYGSVLFDNCTAAMANMIENVQRQAALTITGAYTNTTHIQLLKELGLSLLSQRRIVSKLLMIFKIRNFLTPEYLRNLLPPDEEPHYQTRNAQNIRLPKIKKNYFLKSFIPSSIRLWNSLDNTLRSTAELEDFKNAVKKIFTPESVYKPYLWGFTKEFINLGRLRMGLSGLNAHRKQYHFINHSTCPKCQARREDIVHFLLSCPAYAAPRAEMVANLSRLMPDLALKFQNDSMRIQKELANIMIKGTNNEELDIKVFTTVSKYIRDTERFL